MLGKTKSDEIVGRYGSPFRERTSSVNGVANVRFYAKKLVVEVDRAGLVTDAEFSSSGQR